MKLSVIIATYARPDDLRGAVQSLDRQTRLPDEIIVVAWKGDTPTLTALADLARREPAGSVLPELRVVLTEKNGVTAKENAGMREARGDVLCFMDDDARARPDWLLRLEAHYRDPGVGAAGGRDVIWLQGRVFERETRTVGRVHFLGRLSANHHERVRSLQEVDFLKGCNMSFRREALAPIDERLVGVIPYGFEIDLGLCARRKGWRILYDPDIQVDHYPTTNYSADSREMAFIVNHNQTYVLLKHLAWPRKLAFLAYTFGVGDKNTIGLARVPNLALRHHWPAAVLKAQFAGKLAGIRTYLHGAGRREEA